MNGSFLLWVMMAMVVFWSVGVYNRLMRMRARALDALGSVEKYALRYTKLVETHFAASGTLAPSEKEGLSDGLAGQTWVHLQTALMEMDAALRDARAASLHITAANRLGEQFDGVQKVWNEICHLPGDLAGPVVPDLLRLQWEAITAKVETARSGLNQILTRYNEAIHQFPARLVAGWMGFEPAGLM